MLKLKLAKLALYLIPVLVIVGMCYGIYQTGKSSGKSEVYAEWDVAKKEYAEKMTDLQIEYSIKEQSHREENRNLTNELAQAEKDYAVKLASLHYGHSEQLRKSTERADIYQYQAEAGAVEQRGLASHAARLDLALVEGIRLVGELSATIGQRDRQLIVLGKQIVNDRRVIEDDNDTGTSKE